LLFHPRAGYSILRRINTHSFGEEESDSDFIVVVGKDTGMEPIITRNPRIMHGEPCFAGTRVAVRTFFDHLEAGHSVAGFLEQFPTVRREQVTGLLVELRAASVRAAVPA